MAEDRDEWKILGRNLGTATGWDQTNMISLVAYDFIPHCGIPLDAGVVTFDLERGYATYYGDDGNEIKTIDLITALANIPRDPDTKDA